MLNQESLDAGEIHIRERWRFSVPGRFMLNIVFTILKLRWADGKIEQINGMVICWQQMEGRTHEFIGGFNLDGFFLAVTGHVHVFVIVAGFPAARVTTAVCRCIDCQVVQPSMAIVQIEREPGGANQDQDRRNRMDGLSEHAALKNLRYK